MQLIEELQGWISERVHRKVYVSIRIFNVIDKKVLIVKVPSGPRKPYAYYDPSTKSYIYFKKRTGRIDCLKLEEIETLYYESFVETAEKLQKLKAATFEKKWKISLRKR